MRALAGCCALALSACASGPPAPAGHVGPVTGLAFTAAGLVSCSQAGVRLHAASTFSPALPWRPLTLAASPEGPILVAGGRPGRSGCVALAAEQRLIAQRRLAGDLLYAAAVAPGGAQAAAAGADGRVRLLALPGLTELEVHDTHTAPCRALAFTPDGRTLASAGLDGVVVLRDLAAGTARRLTDHTAGVETLAVDDSGGRFASGARDGKVRIHAREGRLLRTFARLGAAVLAVAWRGEAEVLAGTSDGRLLALTDAGDGPWRELGTFGASIHSLAVAADGSIAVGLQDGTVATVPARE